MRKRNIAVFAVFAFMLVAVGVLLLHKDNKLPILGADYAETQPANDLISQSLENRELPVWSGSIVDTGSTPEVQQGETVINDNQSVTVFHASASKKLNNLSKLHASDFMTPFVSVDEDGTLLNDYLYIEVGIKIKNNEEASKELCLPNITLIASFEGNDAVIAELSTTNLTTRFSKSMSTVTLDPGEEKTYYLGYILTQEEYQKYANTIGLIPDFCGVSSMDRNLLYKIKLDIKELY